MKKIIFYVKIMFFIGPFRTQVTQCIFECYLPLRTASPENENTVLF